MRQYALNAKSHFLEKKYEKYFKMASAEIFTQHAKS